MSTIYPLELNDKIHRKVKATAAERGITMKQLITEALKKQLEIKEPETAKTK